MAQRRLFSLKIVDSDAFIDMPASTQALYFHLGMHADDDGFVNPKKIMRMLGTSEDDLKILLVKRFILSFENGVVVIKHWLIHNTIQKDRYTPTLYGDLKNLLITKDNGSYTECSQNDNISITQVKLSKDKIKIESSLEYLKKIPEDQLEEFYNRFDCDKKAIQRKAEDLLNWCEANGKRKKNYRAFLLTAMRKDFPERKEPMKIRKVVMIDGKPTIAQ